MISLILATGSSVVALTTCVAPNSFAISSLLSSLSTAMIFVAPTSVAPWMTFSPTPPQPKTATLLPSSTFAALMTALTPVRTPQLTSAALSSGMSSRIFTIDVSCTTVYSENEETPV